MLFSIMDEYDLSIKREHSEAAKEIARHAGRLGGRAQRLLRGAKKISIILKNMYLKLQLPSEFLRATVLNM